MNAEHELTITKTIPASAQVLFDAWLDPEALARFIRPAPEMEAPKVENQPEVGGDFLIVMKAGDKELPHRGTYEEIDRPHRLVFTWLSDYTLSGSRVTLTFKELEPKLTEMTLHHRGFPNEEARDNHNQGWSRITELLATTCS